ncbi:MAG: hypothetical protein P8Q45_04605 [Candidatus Thalassarchaeaceae archaeon]|jgi:hypothetical protein|nr:hypothetical protein [Candidatus Thalassarchaeaceae archaeon]
MAADSQTIATVLLSISAAGLIWFILRLRQRRKLDIVEIEKEYSGRAKNPDDLMVPDDNAIAELERLLESSFESEE